MAKGRKPANSKEVEENEVVQDLQQEVNENPVHENDHKSAGDIDKSKELFSMDISKYGIKMEEAEKFVNTALKFYFENKSKVILSQQEFDKLNEVKPISVDSDILEKIKKFEHQIEFKQYIPKNIVSKFLKELQ